MMTRTYTRKRKPRTGILAAGVLSAGVLLGGTAAVSELAAPSPVAAVHAAPSHAETPVATWASGPGGAPATSAKSGGKSHPVLATVGRLALRHVLHVHGIYIRRPWWMRRGRY